MRTRRALSFVLPLLLLTGSDGGVSRARAADEATFSYAAPFYAELDPARAVRANDERLVLALFDTLTTIDARSGEVVSAAASHWEEAADGRSWTFSLRQGARWSDGTPVVASDFVEAWKRALDPYDTAPQAWMFRRLRGVSTISDGERAMTAFSEARRGLEALLEQHKEGIPGREIREVVERSGVRSFAEGIDDADVKRFLRWGGDPYPPDKARQVLERLKDARRDVKRAANDAYDAFGRSVGAVAKDEATVEVLLDGRCPWLPRLVARAAFAPLHPEARKAGETRFDAGVLATNGAYRLKGRGAKAHAGVPNPLSVVHLVRSETYDGPRKGRAAEILCTTGEPPDEVLRRLETGEIRWAADVEEGFGRAGVDADVRQRAEKTPGFAVHPGGGLLVLRFRVDRSPFDRRESRLAFALALDRQDLAARLWPQASPATRLLESGDGGEAPLGAPQEAQAALKAAGWQGKDFPWVELHFAELPGVEDVAERLTRQWEKRLGTEIGLRIEIPSEFAAVLSAGAFGVALGEVEGVVQDPEARVALFAPDHPQGGLGWEDPALTRYVAGALDLDAVVAAGPAGLEGLEDAAALGGKIAAAKGGASGREALRLALLESAARRLLGEVVLVPLLSRVRAEIGGAAAGVGDQAAWSRPGFVGSLRGATP